MQDVYNMPIIHPDLPIETTILHIANALDYLTNTVNDIFSKIDSRIEENCKRTAALKERIDKANDKINRLVGSKKATIVYSSAKYPAGNVHKDPKATFKKDDSLRFKHDDTIVSKPLNYDEKLLNERLHFFHVKTTDTKKTAEKKIPEEGLGFIPNNINSVTSMLLYNTKENPYKRYVSLDPLNASNNSKSSTLDKSNENNVDMEDAPISISNRFNAVKNYADAYFYSPNIGEVPQIDVPIDLPDLPGIADDLSYDFIESGPAIAPSLLNSPTSIILDFPDLDDIKGANVENYNSTKYTADTQILKLPDITTEKVRTSKEDNGDKSILSIGKNLPDLQTNTSKNYDTKVAIPPPPPPMLVPPPPPPSIQEPSKSVSLPSKSAPQADDRASLMAAIRQAGGIGKAKLKAAKPLQEEKGKSTSKSSSSSGGGNLMADLHAKLSMRRKGISGNKSDNSTPISNRGDGGVMDKISAMIPPPPKLDRNTESENDTDWE